VAKKAQTNKNSNTIRDAAIAYATERRWHVFPVPPGTKKSCTKRDRDDPDDKRWGATISKTIICRYWEKYPKANVGIACGESHIFVVETDTPQGHDVDGEASLRELEAKHGALPETRTAVSPSGSKHFYFKAPKGRKVWNSESEIGRGIDVRGEGGMVLAPPSVKPGVGTYRWLNDMDPADAPEWLLALVTKPAKESRPKRVRADEELNDACAEMAATAEGGRNATLNKLAFRFGQLVSRGRINETTVRARLTEAARESGLEDKEIDATIDSGLNAGKQKSRDDPVAEINRSYALMLVGNKTVMMKQNADDFCFISVDAFKQWLSNQYIQSGERMVPLSKYWLAHADRRQYEGVVFAPGEQVSPAQWNLWRGFAVEPREGDCSRFLAHVRDNICQGHERRFKWVMGWTAEIFQQPQQRSGTSLVLRGKEGVGKTKFGQILGSLLGGRHYTLVSEPRYVTGRFNSHLVSCLLLHADEAFWAGDPTAEGKLKDLITGEHQWIEYKGLEPIKVRNFLRLLVSGNPDWLVPAGLEARRFTVLDVGEDHIKDHPYFAAIDAEMANGGREALLHYLLNFDLSTVDLREVLKTRALLDQKLASLSAEESWWLDILQRGRLPGRRDRGANTCSSEALFDSYVDHAKSQGVRRRAIETVLGRFVRRFAPELRVMQPRESGRRRLYVFPPLQGCRDKFAERMQQHVGWGAAQEWEAL
jgi:Bifunctional DNA primase/polymerase, N-terminal/Family of unknown function (DUF5906)